MTRLIRRILDSDRDDTVYRVSMQPAPGKPRFAAGRALAIAWPLGVLCWAAIVWAICKAGGL